MKRKNQHHEFEQNGNIKLLYETGIWYEEASTLTVPLDTSHISCHMEKNHHFDDRILSHFIASPLSSGQRLGTQEDIPI
jgi:hypothetical protein